MNLFDYSKKTTDDYSQWLWDQLPVKCLKSILDIGAGDGELWKEHLSFIPKGASILLMDEDDISLEEAQESLNDQRFNIQVGNVETEDFGQKKFDLVYAGSLLPYIRRRKALYLKIYHSLKKGGHFVGALNGKENLKELCNSKVKKILSPLVPQNPLWKLANQIRLEDVYKELGFVFENCKIMKYENEVNVPNAKMIVDYHLKFEKKMSSRQREELLNYYHSLRAAPSNVVSLTLDWGIVIAKK